MENSNKITKYGLVFLKIFIIFFVITCLIFIYLNNKKYYRNEFYIETVINDYYYKSYTKGDVSYLFLPGDSDVSKISAHYYYRKNSDLIEDDISLEFEDNTSEVVVNNNKYKIIIEYNNLPSLYLQLKDVNLTQINNGDKRIKYKGNTLSFQDSSNDFNFLDNNVEIKGRGNSSWYFWPKKSYQIKLSEKQDLFNFGSSKTWLLISNYADPTLIRNKYIYDMAIDLNMKYTQSSDWVDVWVDGEYQGNYLLAEKVQVDEDRINLTNEYGIIVERDVIAEDDTYSFKTELSESYFNLHDSVSKDKESYKSEIAFNKFKDEINELEKLIYAENKDWHKISSLIDIDSLIKFYFINEFAENVDSVKTVYFYKNGLDDIIHVGPIWDFDASLGNQDFDALAGNPNVDYILGDSYKVNKPNGLTWYKELFTIEEFKNRAIEIYNKEMKPVFHTYIDRISAYQEKIKIGQEINYLRWYDENTKIYFREGVEFHKLLGNVNAECDLIKTWINERLNYMDSKYSENN